MAYFKKIHPKLEAFLNFLRKEDHWLVVINADPDALASAMALRRILSRRVAQVDIAHINEIKRPDNLAMIRYLRIPTKKLTPALIAQYDRFALVDSQPHHSPKFAGMSFSAVIDHHPVAPEAPISADFVEIRPEYGAVSTIMTECLYNLKLRPSSALATALLYGIKTDTASFERQFCDADIKAFRYLSKFANQLILRKIARSEYRLDWLKYFSQALFTMRLMGNQGMAVFMGDVDSPDILVVLADFFLRVHEITWTVVSGIFDHKMICIFRGDGVHKDMGQMAVDTFSDIGSAGGHKAMARAEIPLKKFNKTSPRDILWQRLEPVCSRR